MPPAPYRLSNSTEFDPQTGTPVTIAPGIVRITAPNASPYTYTGTNSFLLGGDELFVVDPGPDSDSHLQALIGAIGQRRVKAVLLTHTHPDHATLAPKLAAAVKAPVWFAGFHWGDGPRPRSLTTRLRSPGIELAPPDRRLKDGERLTIEGMQIEVLATPGHCANHVSFGIVGTPWLVIGDHIMGWSSTLITMPDGSLADYLDSLDRVLAAPWTQYLPAHGAPIMDGPARARQLKAHREARNAQILALLANGPQRLGVLVRAIYPNLTGRRVFAARMTIEAHLHYLAETGQIRLARGPFGLTARPRA